MRRFQFAIPLTCSKQVSSHASPADPLVPSVRREAPNESEAERTAGGSQLHNVINFIVTDLAAPDCWGFATFVSICTTRTVLPLSLAALTRDLTIVSAVVSASSSSWRSCERWSHSRLQGLRLTVRSLMYASSSDIFCIRHCGRLLI